MRSTKKLGAFALLLAVTSAAQLAIPGVAVAQIAVRGETVYPIAGEPITDGVVLIEDGKIERVGPAGQVSIPASYEVLRAAVVMPGLVDARSVVGLAGQYNVDHDQDQLDESEAIQPELRAIDAFNIRERLVTWVRDLGVTTVHTGHGPGKVISGQTMVVKTTGNDVEDAVLKPVAMVVANLGEGATETGGKVPGTRSKAVAILRQALIDAREYAEKEDPERNLRQEMLAKVLAGEVPLMITAHRHLDILAAIRLQEEFGFRLLLDGVADAHLVLDEIRDAGVPVVVHPTMARPGRSGSNSETENVSLTTPAKLHGAGIPFAFQSGFESYVPKTRVVLFEAAMAAAYGLDPEVARHAVTLGAAQILGVDDRVGSLERGKDADLALFDGDPFQYTTHCVGVIIDGQVVSLEAR